jgi:Skp family chaperone for outer membrane proteins
MRKYLNMSVALESNHGAEISMEEAEILGTEAAADSAEVESTLNEADDNLGVVDALEDLAVIADGIDTPTDTEMALIANTENALTIGENLPEGTLIPEVAQVATEGYKGRKISTEGIRETARTIWENIQKFLKKVWEKIESFFYKLFGTIPSLRKNIAALEKRIEADSSKRIEDKKFTIGSGVAALSVDYKPCKSEAELKAALKQFDDAVKTTYTGTVDSSVTLGEKIAEALSNFSPETAADDLTKLNVAISDKIMKLSVAGGTQSLSRFSGYNTMVGHPLLGNISLAVKKPKTKEGDLTSIGFAEFLRNSGELVVPTSETSKEGPKDFEMATMSHPSMLDMLGTCDKMLEVLEEFKRGKRTKDLEKTRKDLSNGSDKATKSIENAKKGEAEDKAAIESYRSMLNYNQAFARWTQQPAMPMYSHTLTVVRAVLVACQKSCACYK